MSVLRVIPLLFALALPALIPARSQAQAPVNSGAEMHLHLRKRIQPFPASPRATEAYFDEIIPAPKTAIVITDMWDRHWCTGATRRVGEIARKMEPLLEKARASGILIIHAPSETMNFYANAPGRLLAEHAPIARPPSEIALQQPPLPIDDSDGGCDTPGDHEHQAWTREISTLTIAPGDVISDNGAEIYNVLKEHHIETVLFMGVHANMCILNRTFGIRQMTKWGLHCILVRDLTDAMYNPAMSPHVSRDEGVELVIEYIEQYNAPSVTSGELLAALPRR